LLRMTSCSLTLRRFSWSSNRCLSSNILRCSSTSRNCSSA
jgi:hypothetical protein